MLIKFFYLFLFIASFSLQASELVPIELSEPTDLFDTSDSTVSCCCSSPLMMMPGKCCCEKQCADDFKKQKTGRETNEQDDLRKTTSPQEQSQDNYLDKSERTYESDETDPHSQVVGYCPDCKYWYAETNPNSKNRQILCEREPGTDSWSPTAHVIFQKNFFQRLLQTEQQEATLVAEQHFSQPAESKNLKLQFCSYANEHDKKSQEPLLAILCKQNVTTLEWEPVSYEELIQAVPSCRCVFQNFNNTIPVSYDSLRTKSHEKAFEELTRIVDGDFLIEERCNAFLKRSTLCDQGILTDHNPHIFSIDGCVAFIKKKFDSYSHLFWDHIFGFAAENPILRALQANEHTYLLIKNVPPGYSSTTPQPIAKKH